MKHLIKIKNLDMNLEPTIPEWVIFEDENADLIIEWTEKSHFLWFKQKDLHKRLWRTLYCSYVMESWYEGDEPCYEVISRDCAADLVRERDSETFIKCFKPRIL